MFNKKNTSILYENVLKGIFKRPKMRYHILGWEATDCILVFLYSSPNYFTSNVISIRISIVIIST